MTSTAPRYHHTQRAPLYLILLAGAAAFAGMLAGMPMPPAARITPAVAMVVFVLLAFCFKTLTVADEGDHLALRYGPLPVFRKRIPYEAITEVRRSRSRMVDGWGIHKILGRGWTWNLWGFDCAELRVDGQTLRVGSDDADGLVEFLKTRLGHDDSVARLTALPPTDATNRIGLAAGQLTVPNDIDVDNPRIAALFGAGKDPR